MAKGFCPECDADIELGNPVHKGAHVTCHSCGAYLVVIGESPIELDWADDDWYDDDDEDDDDYDYDD